MGDLIFTNSQHQGESYSLFGTMNGWHTSAWFSYTHNVNKPSMLCHSIHRGDSRRVYEYTPTHTHTHVLLVSPDVGETTSVCSEQGMNAGHCALQWSSFAKASSETSFRQTEQPQLEPARVFFPSSNASPFSVPSCPPRHQHFFPVTIAIMQPDRHVCSSHPIESRVIVTNICPFIASMLERTHTRLFVWALDRAGCSLCYEKVRTKHKHRWTETGNRNPPIISL